MAPGEGNVRGKATARVESFGHAQSEKRQLNCRTPRWGGYWYRLAMVGLVLDRSCGSVTLNALAPVERATVEASRRAGVLNEAIGTPPIDAL
jgi:hypothetical protein